MAITFCLSPEKRKHRRGSLFLLYYLPIIFVIPNRWIIIECMTRAKKHFLFSLSVTNMYHELNSSKGNEIVKKKIDE